MEKGTTVYISGAMTGVDCMNFKEFFYWHKMLEKSGYLVINPAEIDCRKMLYSDWKYKPCMWEEIIQEDIKLIEDHADWLFVLNGWEGSKGANREIAAAAEKGISVFYEDLRI